MTRRLSYIYSSLSLLLNFLSWDLKWPPPIFRHSSALGLTSLTALYSLHLLLVQGITKVSDNLLQPLEGAGLDSSDLCITD